MSSAAVIWDLDGTLIDSYQMIIPSLRLFYAEQGLEFTDAEIADFVLTRSTKEFSEMVDARYGVQLEAHMARYREIRTAMEAQMPPATESRRVLDALAARGVVNCLFTHRGVTTAAMLRRTGLEGAFAAIVTAEDGFARKPAPDALLYLMQTLDLDPTRCCYVGDRPMDMCCAQNAGICGVLYHPEDSPAPLCKADRVIRSLWELMEDR